MCLEILGILYAFVFHSYNITTYSMDLHDKNPMTPTLWLYNWFSMTNKIRRILFRNRMFPFLYLRRGWVNAEQPLLRGPTGLTILSESRGWRGWAGWGRVTNTREHPSLNITKSGGLHALLSLYLSTTFGVFVPRVFTHLPCRPSPPVTHQALLLPTIETTLCSLQPPPPPPSLASPSGTKEAFSTCHGSSQWTAPQRLSDPSHSPATWLRSQLTSTRSSQKGHLETV